MMRKRFWVLAAIAVLLMAIGPSPRYLEELRIGGGFGDTDGGVDLDAVGNVDLDGHLTFKGVLTAGSGANQLTDSARLLDGGKLQVGTVLAAALGTGSVTTTEIADNTVGTADLAPDSVTSTEIVVDTIVAADIAASAVDTSELAADAVTTTEILGGTILTGDIATDTILAGNIAAGAVATSEILDGTIAPADLDNTASFTVGGLTVQGGDIVAGVDSTTRGLFTLWDGSSAAPGALRLVSTDGTASRWLFIQNDGTLRTHSSLPTADSDGVDVDSGSGSGFWSAATGGIEYSGGNVGINDTTPSFKLDVNGTGRFTGEVDFDANIDVETTGSTNLDIIGFNSSIDLSDKSTPTTGNGHDFRMKVDTDRWELYADTNEDGTFNEIQMRVDINSDVLRFYTAGTQALDFDGSQNAAFASSVTVGHDLFLTSGQLNIIPGATAEGIVLREADDGNDAAKLTASSVRGTLRLFYNGTENVTITGDGDATFDKDVVIGDDVEINGDYLKLPVKTTTGDPAAPADGWMYVNTFDNEIRVYADGEWRELATW